MKPRSYIDERIAERRRRAVSGAVAAAVLAAVAFSVLAFVGPAHETNPVPFTVASSAR